MPSPVPSADPAMSASPLSSASNHYPQFRWRLRNSRILRLASVDASSLYSNQRPNMALPGWSSG
jgi:hypothetical protein